MATIPPQPDCKISKGILIANRDKADDIKKIVNQLPDELR